jgi:aspartate dehydrogenase
MNKLRTVPGLLKIGIVGCGAIGASLAQAVARDFSPQAELAGLYDTDAQKAYNLASKLKNQKLVAFNLENLIAKTDLVIEATKAEAALSIAQKTLALSKDILVMSVGGIMEHAAELKALAEEKNANIYIPSGAICGIDGLKAAGCAKINKVTLTTKKPAKAFIGVPYVLKRQVRLDDLKEDTVLFEGDAYTATRAFPQNINVAATLSLAGIGPEKTTVRIVASPQITQNIHEVEIESDAGRITARTENVIHPDNPKTSFLAVLSATATLKQIISPIKIGT